MVHKFTWLRTGGVFQQFSKIADISCGRIAEYAVPKAALAPCFHVERKFLCHWRLFVPPAPKRSLLKDEYRNQEGSLRGRWDEESPDSSSHLPRSDPS